MIWRATVVRVLGDGSVYVVVPRLTGQQPRGPYLTLVGLGLAEGDKVLVAYLEGSKDKLVILGRYQPAG